VLRADSSLGTFVVVGAAVAVALVVLGMVPGVTDNAHPARDRTLLVSRIIDGDTLELANGETVRLAGIDAPERGTCGSLEATESLRRFALGEAVRLTPTDEDRDGYGRLLRYVDVDGDDAGLRLIEDGLAVARYDSRDGYGAHPREVRYIVTDQRSENHVCRGSEASRRRDGVLPIRPRRHRAGDTVGRLAGPIALGFSGRAEKGPVCCRGSPP
jgi:endonuclease YncB( thermonuclease family)